jgi:hypothetical protein
MLRTPFEMSVTKAGVSVQLPQFSSLLELRSYLSQLAEQGRILVHFCKWLPKKGGGIKPRYAGSYLI